MNEMKLFITPAEAGKLIGVNGVTVRTMIIDGVWKVPHIFSGKRMKIYYEPLMEMIHTGTLTTGLPTSNTTYITSER